MNEQTTSSATGGERVYEPCMCRQAVDWWLELIQVPQSARRHLRNSRIEFLKAVRSVIDERIEYLSRSGQQQGTTVPIE